MSKKYDEYVEKMKKEGINFYSSPSIGMFPTNDIDKELEREIRDRAIISLVKLLMSEGKEFTYGDIVAMIDGNKEELDYETSKESRAKSR